MQMEYNIKNTLKKKVEFLALHYYRVTYLFYIWIYVNKNQALHDSGSDITF